MRQIRRNKSHEPIIKTLLGKVEGLDKAVFSSIRDVMVLAAGLGYELRRRVRLDRDPILLDSDPFANHARTRDFMYTLALAETQDQDLLKAEETPSEVVEVFEEYACGGFGLLAEWLDGSPDQTNHAFTIIEGLRRLGALNPNLEAPPSDDVDF